MPWQAGLVLSIVLIVLVKVMQDLQKVTQHVLRLVQNTSKTMCFSGIWRRWKSHTGACKSYAAKQVMINIGKIHFWNTNYQLQVQNGMHAVLLGSRSASSTILACNLHSRDF